MLVHIANGLASSVASAILFVMHYNLNERLKPKKHLPWKKILVVSIIILVSIAVYVLFIRSGGQTPPPDGTQPT